MRKNKLMVIALGLVAAVALTSSVVSRTYAKYQSSVTGSSTATVAKWVVKAGTSGSEALITSGSAVTFNLFSTINDTNGGAAETDVASGKIAPGTTGSFTLSIKNESEVTAEYGITYTVTNTSNIPIEYSVDNGTTWTTTLANVTASAATKLDMTGANATKTVTVMWRWAFEGSGSSNFTSSQTTATDTTLGTAATAPTITVQAQLTVTQVD